MITHFRFLNELETVCIEAENIKNSVDFTENEKSQKLSELGLHGVAIDDLALTMTFAPSSTIHQYDQISLCEDGENIEVRFFKKHYCFNMYII